MAAALCRIAPVSALLLLLAAPAESAPPTKANASASVSASVDRPEGGFAVYDAKEILEKADKLNERLDSRLDTFLAIASVLFALGIPVFGYWYKQTDTVKNRLDSLESRHKTLDTEFVHFRKLLEQVSRLTIETSAYVDFGPIKHLESDFEREALKRAIARIEENIDVKELEVQAILLNNIYPLPYYVFSSLGIIRRYRGYYCDNDAQKHEHYNSSIRHYLRALEKAKACQGSTGIDSQAIVVSDLHQAIGICYSWIDKYAEARLQIEEAIQIRSRARQPILSINHETLGFAMMRLGDHVHAHWAFNRALAGTENQAKVIYNLACNQALWGDKAAAGSAERADRYEAAITALMPIAEVSMVRNQLTHDKDFDGLRSDPSFGPRFQALLPA